MCIESLDTIRKYLNSNSQTISSNQAEISEQIILIDKRISIIDKKIEEKMKSSTSYSKEMNRIEMINDVSGKMSSSLRTLAIKLNRINQALPDEHRLETFSFD